MVPVEVGDADRVNLVRRDPREQHLPLRSLTGVEQEPLPVPAQHVPVVVTSTGRHLARGAKHHKLATRHPPTLPRRLFMRSGRPYLDKSGAEMVVAHEKAS